jgi:hypothetical protein
VEVEPVGNVLVAAAFLFGLAAEELTPDELNTLDPDYEFLVCARAVRETGQRPASAEGPG